jgi:hypothetical protein
MRIVQMGQKFNEKKLFLSTHHPSFMVCSWVKVHFGQVGRATFHKVKLGHVSIKAYSKA